MSEELDCRAGLHEVAAYVIEPPAAPRAAIVARCAKCKKRWTFHVSILDNTIYPRECAEVTDDAGAKMEEAVR